LRRPVTSLQPKPPDPPEGLTPELLAAYDATRSKQARGVVCHFPWTTLNFDQEGRATACCYNRKHVLGRYPVDSLEDMWAGTKAEELRGYIARAELSHGCEGCRNQLLARNFDGVLARNADHYAVPNRRHPPMPSAFEFELANTCNLECIMCSGYFSSSIRRNRERRPPQTSPYDATFVEQLVPFLPHLRFTRFLGGEPFLIGIYYEIWDQILKHNPSLEVSITTNATVLKPRTRKILESLQSHIVVSIDALSRTRYEQIRVNADYDSVFDNVEFLRRLTVAKGTSMSFAVCPMTINWDEMPAIVDYCNAHDIEVHFNTVTWPSNLSLRDAGPIELERVESGLSTFDPPGGTVIERANRNAYVSLVSQIAYWRQQSVSTVVEISNQMRRSPRLPTDPDQPLLRRSGAD
jgi:MoaA/NifB/PqqE/SkfB family radical SAM enzyme